MAFSSRAPLSGLKCAARACVSLLNTRRLKIEQSDLTSSEKNNIVFCDAQRNADLAARNWARRGRFVSYSRTMK